MRTFRLICSVPAIGGADIGQRVVAEGVIFQDGQTVVRWLFPTHSMDIYDSLDDVLTVGHGVGASVEFLT
jgi:hypothetical protein